MTIQELAEEVKTMRAIQDLFQMHGGIGEKQKMMRSQDRIDKIISEILELGKCGYCKSGEVQYGCMRNDRVCKNCGESWTIK